MQLRKRMTGGLHELMWRDSQDILTKEVKHKIVSIAYYLSCMKEMGVRPDLDISSHCLFMASRIHLLAHRVPLPTLLVGARGELCVMDTSPVLLNTIGEE